MAQTKEGAKKVPITIKAKYGEDYYARIGAMGGKAGSTGGFYGDRERAREAGAKGGRISKIGFKYIGNGQYIKKEA